MSASIAYGRSVPMEVIGKYVDQAPVDLDCMARDLDVRVTYDAGLPESISGMIEREGNGFHVTINAGHSPKRQRFTLAHELAHRILHADLVGDGITDNAMYRSATLPDEKERQADSFAAELIMPAQKVRRLYKAGVTSFAAMAEAFNVSFEAAKVRMRWLRLGG